jgi:hypothetical protein
MLACCNVITLVLRNAGWSLAMACAGRLRGGKVRVLMVDCGVFGPRSVRHLRDQCRRAVQGPVADPTD